MAELSHQKARDFMQIAADGTLPANNQALLEMHLSKCRGCREYEQRLSSLENRLCKITRAQWDNQQPKINLQTIISSPGEKIITVNFSGLTQNLGKVIILAVLVLGYFLIANLENDQFPFDAEIPTTLPVPLAQPFITATSPTPSAQFSLMGSTTQNCEPINYIVQASDTLASIANHFSISQKTIISNNLLTDDNLTPGEKLSIPVCDQTPTRTASTPTNTFTITPKGEILLSAQPD